MRQCQANLRDLITLRRTLAFKRRVEGLWMGATFDVLLIPTKVFLIPFKQDHLEGQI